MRKDILLVSTVLDEWIRIGLILALNYFNLILEIKLNVRDLN